MPELQSEQNSLFAGFDTDHFAEQQQIARLHLHGGLIFHRVRRQDAHSGAGYINRGRLKWPRTWFIKDCNGHFLADFETRFFPPFHAELIGEVHRALSGSFRFPAPAQDASS